MGSFIRGTFLLPLIVFGSWLPCRSQTIKGIVVDSINRPLNLVSVILLKDSNFVAGAVTDENGHFTLRHSPEKAKYTLHLTLIGYSPLEMSFVFSDTNLLKKLVLHENSGVLAEVSVSAKRALITQRPDRYVINVENSVLANGFSAVEVLQRSPGVWVDNSGNIRLKGTQPVTVMINRVIQRMSPEELADYLRSLKSEDISRVEVIPIPPPEFEAEGSGGVIQVFLKKGRQNGLNGSVYTQYAQQQRKPYFTTGGTVNYMFRKLYFLASYGYVKDIRSVTERTNIFYADHRSYHNSTDRRERIGRQQYRFATNYDINRRQTINVEAAFAKTKQQLNFFSNEVYFNDTSAFTLAQSHKRRIFELGEITVNYSIALDTAGSELLFILDYSTNDRMEKNNFFQQGIFPDRDALRRTDAPTNTAIHTAQSDYTQALGTRTVLKAGLKYASIDRNNLLTTEQLTDSTWLVDPLRSNHFIYSEQLLMLYSAIEQNVKRVTIKAGLRAEETYSNGNAVSSGERFSRKYFGLFPSVFIMRTVSPEKETSVSVAYSRRLTRPAMTDLNPARLEYSSYTALIGNPNLRPEYTNNFSVTYQFLKNHSSEIYFTRTRNSISLSAKSGANNSIDYYSSNTGAASQYGFSYSSTISPSKEWTFINNFSLFRSVYNFDGKPYRQTSYSASSLHTVSITRFADVDIIGEYRSPYIYTNLYTYGNFIVDVGLTKKLIKGKLRARFWCTDLFNISREKELTDDNGTRLEFYRKRPTRALRLSMTYNFSSGRKITPKKIDHGNSEERSRVGN